MWLPPLLIEVVAPPPPPILGMTVEVAAPPMNFRLDAGGVSRPSGQECAAGGGAGDASCLIIVMAISCFSLRS